MNYYSTREITRRQNVTDGALGEQIRENMYSRDFVIAGLAGEAETKV